MSLQEALKMMRLELGLTQNDLAQKTGKAFVTINRWENGNGFPSRENAKNILKIAKNGCVSNDCYAYLVDTLMPDVKRVKAATEYGFPNIDREFLFMLADGSMNSLYVIEAGTYQLLYANRTAEKAAIQRLREQGHQIGDRSLMDQKDKRCFHYFGNSNQPCSFCPLKSVNSSEFTDQVIKLPDTERILRVHAKAAKIKKKNVYVIYMTDITDQSAERNALYELTNDISDGVGIYHVYSDGRIELVFMNEAFYQMIGAEKKEALLKNGETDLSLIHPEDREKLRTEINAAIAQKRTISLTMRMHVIDNSFRTVRMEGKYIKRDAEKITFYCRFHDLGQHA